MIEDLKINKNKTYLITHIDDKKLKFLEETFTNNEIDYKIIDDKKLKFLEEIKKPGIYLAIMENGYGFEDLNTHFEIITPNEFAPGKIVKNSKYQKFLKDTVKIYNKDELKPGDLLWWGEDK